MGMAAPAHAEVIPDVEEGTSSPAGVLGELSAEEQAAFDAMRPEPGSDSEDAGAGEDAGTVDADAGTTPPAEGEKAPPQQEAPPAEGEDDDGPDAIINDPKTGKPQKTVNFGKHQRLLSKAEQKAQAAETALQQERINQAKLSERLAILNEALTAPPPQQQQQPQQPTNPMLEPTIDPVDNAIEALAQLQRRQEWMNKTSASIQEQTQTQLADQQLLQDFERDTVAFAGTPEGQHFFGDDGAYQFLKNSRLIELGISLFDKDPTDPNVQFTQTEVNKMISDFNAEEKWVVNNARAQRKSAAQAIMRLAKGRGWKPPAPAAAAPAAAAAPQGGIPPAPAARAPAAPAAPGSAVAKIQAETEAAAASRSLSDGGGAPPGEPLTAERLLKMNDEEFGRYVDNLPKDRLDAIMGRDQERR